MANATYLGLDRSGWRGVGTGATIGGGALSIYGTLRSGKEAEAAGRQDALIIRRNALATHFDNVVNAGIATRNSQTILEQIEQEGNLRRKAVTETAASVAGQMVGRGVNPNSESYAAIQSAIYRAAEEDAILKNNEAYDKALNFMSQREAIMAQDYNMSIAAEVEAATAIARGKAARLASYGQAAGQGLSMLGSLATFGAM